MYRSNLLGIYAGNRKDMAALLDAASSDDSDMEEMTISKPPIKQRGGKKRGPKSTKCTNVSLIGFCYCCDSGLANTIVWLLLHFCITDC